MFYHIHIVGIVIAAVAAMIVGTVWYAPFVFGKKWMSLAGFPRAADLSPERRSELKKKANKRMVFSLITSLLTAFVLERIMYNTPMVTLELTIIMSLLLWLGFVAATNINEFVYAAAPKPWALYFINQGAQLAMILVMTLALYFFA